VFQHVDWLETEIEKLLDAEFLARGKTPIDRNEIAWVRKEIDERRAIIGRYRLLGLLAPGEPDGPFARFLVGDS
jgi:hypothetical protein